MQTNLGDNWFQKTIMERPEYAEHVRSVVAGMGKFDGYGKWAIELYLDLILSTDSFIMWSSPEVTRDRIRDMVLDVSHIYERDSVTEAEKTAIGFILRSEKQSIENMEKLVTVTLQRLRNSEA